MPLALAALAGLLAWLWPAGVPWPQIVLGVLGVGVVLFFRDPERAVPDEPNALLAPADGQVTDILEVDDAPFLEGAAIRIGIFLSIFDVHINRAPCAGRVENIDRQPGRCINAMKYQDASRWNRACGVGMDCPDHPAGRVLVKQITGAIARRIVTAVAPGDALAAGQRFGMIKFGSRTELYLLRDPRARILVRPGDVVRAGRTVLVRYEAPDQTA